MIGFFQDAHSDLKDLAKALQAEFTKKKLETPNGKYKLSGDSLIQTKQGLSVIIKTHFDKPDSWLSCLGPLDTARKYLNGLFAVKDTHPEFKEIFEQLKLEEMPESSGYLSVLSQASELLGRVAALDQQKNKDFFVVLNNQLKQNHNQKGKVN